LRTEPGALHNASIHGSLQPFRSKASGNREYLRDSNYSIGAMDRPSREFKTLNRLRRSRETGSPRLRKALCDRGGPFTIQGALRIGFVAVFSKRKHKPSRSAYLAEDLFEGHFSQRQVLRPSSARRPLPRHRKANSRRSRLGLGKEVDGLLAPPFSFADGTKQARQLRGANGRSGLTLRWPELADFDLLDLQA
jgi:hypothetical protein